MFALKRIAGLPDFRKKLLTKYPGFVGAMQDFLYVSDPIEAYFRKNFFPTHNGVTDISYCSIKIRTNFSAQIFFQIELRQANWPD